MSRTETSETAVQREQEYQEQLTLEREFAEMERRTRIFFANMPDPEERVVPRFAGAAYEI